MDDIQTNDLELTMEGIEDDTPIGDIQALQENQESTETETVEKAVEDKVEETPSEEVKEEVVSEEAVPNAPYMTIKFNHESLDLSKDEAISLAQKGKNYDALQSKYDSLRAQESYYSDLDRLAKANSMTINEYVQGLIGVQRDFEINAELENLRNSYPDEDDAALMKQATINVMERGTAQKNAAIVKEQEVANARKQEISRQLDVFSKRYPSVDASKLDQGVYSLMKEGYTLLEAYQAVEADKTAQRMKALDSQAKIKQQQDENKSKSLGNISNLEADEDGNDAAIFAKYMGL